MNQIARTFTLVGLIVVILLALHFLPKLSVGETELRRVNLLSDVLPEVESNAFDFVPEAPPLPPEVGTIPPTVSTAPEAPSTPLTPSTPSTPVLPQGGAKDSTASKTIVAPSGAEGGASILDYSQGGSASMYHFYQALANVKQMNRPVRVAYYGDSFIEGDIFTADLRELLQDQFGGNGVGWVDCASQVNGFRTTVTHHFSGIHEYEVVKRPFKPTNQGIAQRYFTAANGATITYKGTKVRRHLAEWDKAIFYLRTNGGLTLRATINGDTTLVNTVEGSQNLQTVVHTGGFAPKDSLQQPRNISSVSYAVSNIGEGSLLYGAALEGEHGVVVDNFSMRGSAGYTLVNIPSATLAQFAAKRPYDLIVLHFGLNVANAKQANYSGYTKQMGEAIDHLRQAYPGVSILVVSMPDRDQRTDAGLRTMKGVEQLVAYQQIMASDHAVAFFNLFEAMGGRESMKGLVEQGLANKDYTHINFKGGRYLARFLYDALMAGYHSSGF